VHAHLTEVPTKAWLEESAGGEIERLAGRAEHIMHDRWRLRGGLFGQARWLHFQLLILFLPGGTFEADLRGRGRDRETNIGHTHHLLGDVIRLSFERVIHSPDGKFSLQTQSRE
jgi:hypothetical protein